MTRTAKLAPVAVLLAVLLALACASRFHGDAHGDASYDFSKVRVIAIDPHKGRDLPKDSREVNQMIDAQIRKQLQAKGYSMGSLEEADLTVTYYAGLRAKVRMSGGATAEGTDARATMQFFEPGSRYSVWYGWANATWRQSMDADVEAEVEKAVTFLLDRFPAAGHSQMPIPGKKGMEGQVM